MSGISFSFATTQRDRWSGTEEPHTASYTVSRSEADHIVRQLTVAPAAEVTTYPADLREALAESMWRAWCDKHGGVTSLDWATVNTQDHWRELADKFLETI